jgi:FlaA1/EpsC-like NDP-sugar epimerase
LNTLNVTGRSESLFASDFNELFDDLFFYAKQSRFLIIGGSGSIGQAVTKEIFKFNPKAIHVVDISENNLVELVRDLRSSLGYIDGDFKTFAIDCGSIEFEALIASAPSYDYILNLSALKHVRSEKDPFTLMRMIQINIINSIKIADLAIKNGAKKYFCVSTDKAANPVNIMGASKLIMEMFLMRKSLTLPVSMSRFANVAFSDGSLLHGFEQRFRKNQPISAPNDVKRYFITPQESGELCLMSCLLGKNKDIFFPKLSKELNLISFSEIAIKYLHNLGYEPFECSGEDEARNRSKELISKKQWPCYFFKSDTTGEKDSEEFFTDKEDLDMSRFQSIGIIRNKANSDESKLNQFLNGINKLYLSGIWSKDDILELFLEINPDFNHKETGKYLDQKM